MSAPSGPPPLGLFVAGCLAASLALQFSFQPVIGSDGFFHIRAAERVFGGGMPWLPLSVFADGWVDHQLLFHILLWPLAAAFPGVVAAKLAGALLAVVATLSLHRTLTGLRAPHAALLAASPLLGWLFWLRLEMPRAQGLSVALLLLTFGALTGKRWRTAFALAFAYAWTYHVSLVLLPLAAALIAARAARERALDLRPVLAVGGGLLAGFAIHPHSPGTLRFAWQHVVLKVLNRDGLPVGGEWVDGGLVPLLRHGWPALLALAGSGLLLRVRWRRMASETGAALLLAAGATGAILVGTKPVEYALPLAALALGLAARDAGARLPTPLVKVAWVGLALALLLSGLRVRQAVIATEPDPYARAAALAWLAEHAEPGERVFHFSWNDFPELVFHGPQFEYIAGLDPHFLALHDPELWRLYEQLGGPYTGLRSQAIAERFGARWAVLVLPHPGAREALAADPGLHKTFDDGGTLVFAVAPPGRDTAVPAGP